MVLAMTRPQTRGCTGIAETEYDTCRKCSSRPNSLCLLCGDIRILPIYFPPLVDLEDRKAMKHKEWVSMIPKQTVIVEAADVERMYFRNNPDRWRVLYRSSQFLNDPFLYGYSIC